jgi:hypothetical protein
MKIFLFSVLITFLASISAQEKAEKPSSEEAQIVEDDDQQILSEKKDQQSQKSHKIIEDDEELILDDSEEYLIAPANVAKPRQHFRYFRYHQNQFHYNRLCYPG